MGQSLLSTIICLATLLFGTLGASLSIPRISELNRKLRADQNLEQEALYLPNQEAIKFLSFGYKNVASHVMWFKTISYFGKHYSSDRDLRWLRHMCFLTLELDGRAKHAYQFCANMLSWEANDPNGSVAILNKAITTFPDDWLFLYLRGFTKYYFLKDSSGAKEDFVSAAQKPQSPALIARLAAKQMAQLDTPDAAIEFLSGVLQSEKDPQARQALKGRLDDALLARDLRLLEQGVATYQSRNGTMPRSIEELITAGIVSSVGQDPFGGVYEIDSDTGKVISSSQKKSSHGGSKK